MPDPLILAEGLAVDYGRRRVVDGVSLRVDAGEILALAGPNGAGKTTLLHTLCGAIKPAAGELRLCGDPPARLKARERGRRAALIPQREETPFGFTAREQALLGRMPWSRGFAETAEDHRLAAEALEACGISHLADRPITEMSGGERQAVAAARAWAAQTPVLLMDEPTASLDPARGLRMADLARLAARQGKAVVIATHDLNWAMALDCRMLLMAQGRPVWTGPARECAEHLSGAYGVNFALGAAAGLPVVAPLAEESPA